MTTLERLAPYRAVLYVLAAIGLLGLNGTFLVYALFQPELMAEALANPIALVFILEAFVMMGFIAWLIARSGLAAPGWGLFVVFSMIGGIAFSAPAFLLLRLRKEAAHGDVPQTA